MDVKIHQTPAPTVNPNELNDANSNPNVPKLYFNGFTIGLTNADVVILAKRNNEPQAVINVSLTVAKTLVKQLSALIIELENKSEKEIMTTDVIDVALKKIMQPKK